MGRDPNRRGASRRLLPGSSCLSQLRADGVAILSHVKNASTLLLAFSFANRLSAWPYARRSVIRVNSDGRPSRSAKPGQSAVTLFTYKVIPSTSYRPETYPALARAASRAGPVI